MQSLLLPAPWFASTHSAYAGFDLDPGIIIKPQQPRSFSTGFPPSLRAATSFPLMSSSPPATHRPAISRGPERQPPHASLPGTTNGASHVIPTPTHHLLSISRDERGFAPPLQPPGGLLTPGVIHSDPTISQSSTYSGVIPALIDTANLPPATSGPPVRNLLPRSTRRAKTHVASACVNCKRKHLGCDSARPCRRCVQAGKQSTCVDVTHKKRGRPPLKADDAPLRTYTNLQVSDAARSLPHGSELPRGHRHSRTSSREIRPITDLQFSRPGEFLGLEYGGGELGMNLAPRWTSPSSVHSHQASIPPAGMIGGAEGRFYTSPGSLHQPQPFYPPTPHDISPNSIYPRSCNAPVVTASPRPIFPHSDHPHAHTPPTISPQQYHPPTFGTHVSSYESPTTPTRPATQEAATAVSRPLPDPYQSAIHLPPLLPTTRNLRQSPSGHRRSDSYPYSAGPFSFRKPPDSAELQFQQTFQPREGSSTHASSNLMEPPFSYSEASRSSFSTASRHSSFALIEHEREHAERSTGQLISAQASLQTQTQGWHRSPTANPAPGAILASQIEPPKEARQLADDDEKDEESTQPRKRRRMALDNIVND